MFGWVLAAVMLGSGWVRGQAVVEPSEIAAPSDEMARQWLLSGDGRVQAWGAHAVLVGEKTGLLPKVEEVIAQAVMSFEGERVKAQAAGKPRFPPDGRLLAAMLDVIIQLHGHLPVEVLAGLEGWSENPKLVLLERMPWSETEPVWKAMYQPGGKGSATATRVAAEMLARHATSGFAVKLLASVLVSIQVEVHNANEGRGYGLGYSSCCGIGGGAAEKPWPEMGAYLLFTPKRDEKPPRGATVWLDGPDRILLVRKMSKSYWGSECGAGVAPLNDAIRSHVVGTLLGGSPASPLPEEAVVVEIEFHDREAYRAAVVEAVEEQQRNFAGVAQALTAKGLMTEEERQAAVLRVELTLVDSRKKPAVDLPEIVFREPVGWVGR